MPNKTGIKNKEIGIKEKKTPKPIIASEAKSKMPGGVTVDLFDTKGVKTTMTVPKEVFGVKANKQLLAQAVRVYLANQRMGTAKVKTRGEVTGSTRKIYQQKGTGRARHGGIRAPIFVGGGVVFGPRPHDFSMSMPKKMRKQALFQALSSKKTDNGITFVKGLETVEAKTKTMAAVLKKIGISGKNIMVVVPADAKTTTVSRGARNITGVTLMPVNQLTAYEVLRSTSMLFMQDTMDTIKMWVKEK